MTKLLTITTEINNCGECCNVMDWHETGKKDWRCNKHRGIIKDIWGEIPKWCPLEDKK